MLIEIQKIRRVAVRDEHGKKVSNPEGEGVLMEEKTANEAIDVGSIKSIRPFRDDGTTHRRIDDQNFDGEICVIYLYNTHPNEDESDNDSKRVRRTSEVHVVANFKELLKEVNELKAKSL